MHDHLFKDRADAAAQLISALPDDIDANWLVLGLPRGGVPLAAEIARHLGGKFDILIVRKVGAPGNPELAVAAVTGPGPEQIAINRSVQRMCGLSDAEVFELAAGPVREVQERRRLWSRLQDVETLKDRDVLIVDDGAATGTTLQAALDAARHQGARQIVVAVPVALSGALDKLNRSGVRIICPYRPDLLSAVGGAYRDFPQVSDSEVSALLAASRHDEMQ